MTDQSTQTEPARIDDLLATYRDLQSQFDRVLDRLRRAEEQRNTVQRRIYDRVRAEYDRELDSIRARMSPVRDEIDRMHESLEAQWRDATSMVQAVEEELAEAEFRHRIGEYETHRFEDLRQGLDARAEEARARQALLQATLGTITSLRRPESQEEPAPADAPVHEEELVVDHGQDLVVEVEPPVIVPEPAPAEAVEVAAPRAPGPAAPEALEIAAAPAVETPVENGLPRRPVLSAGRIAPANRGDSFENPHDWISEMGSEGSRPERRARPVSPPPPPAPPSPAEEIDSLLTPVPTPAAGFPSLVFVSGVHVGQAIGLLPTTLTIGREHDNNIEIKDPEVARYHARILRERGDYVVEDLNSSTGTWVNGERKQRAVLTHGDVIRVGQTELALDFEWTTDPR